MANLVPLSPSPSPNKSRIKSGRTRELPPANHPASPAHPPPSLSSSSPVALLPPPIGVLAPSACRQFAVAGRALWMCSSVDPRSAKYSFFAFGSAFPIPFKLSHTPRTPLSIAALEAGVNPRPRISTASSSTERLAPASGTPSSSALPSDLVNMAAFGDLTPLLPIMTILITAPAIIRRLFVQAASVSAVSWLHPSFHTPVHDPHPPPPSETLAPSANKKQNQKKKKGKKKKNTLSAFTRMPPNLHRLTVSIKYRCWPHQHFTFCHIEPLRISTFVRAPPNSIGISRPNTDSHAPAVQVTSKIDREIGPSLIGPLSDRLSTLFFFFFFHTRSLSILYHVCTLPALHLVLCHPSSVINL